jgi:hypothetical protein
MSARGRNHGLRKLCGCGRARWPKCPHAWHFSFKPRGGVRWRFSLDHELGRHLDSKEEAKSEADRIRTEIRQGTFRRADGMRPPTLAPVGQTLDQLATSYFAAVKATGKRSAASDASRLVRLCTYDTLDGRRLGAWQAAEITEDVLEGFHASLRAADLAASTRNHTPRS